MSEAKRCDACNKLYVPCTDEDMMNRPIIRTGSVVSKKRFTGMKLYSVDKVVGYKDLCPDCAQKVADQFVNTNVFEKEESIPDDPSTGETETPDIPNDTEEKEDE